MKAKQTKGASSAWAEAAECSDDAAFNRRITNCRRFLNETMRAGARAAKDELCATGKNSLAKGLLKIAAEGGDEGFSLSREAFRALRKAVERIENEE